LSFLRHLAELAYNFQAFGADAFEQPSDGCEAAATAGGLDLSEAIGENRGADSARAGLERVCRALDRFGISFVDRLLQCREAPGTILNKSVEENSQHLLYATFAKVSAEALNVYVWR
jgi:hypothetical protein